MRLPNMNTADLTRIGTLNAGFIHRVLKPSDAQSTVNKLPHVTILSQAVRRSLHCINRISRSTVSLMVCLQNSRNHLDPSLLLSCSSSDELNNAVLRY